VQKKLKLHEKVMCCIEPKQIFRPEMSKNCISISHRMKNFKETHQFLLVVFAKTALYMYVTFLSANMAGSDLSHRVKKGKEKGKEV
jgi:hypothetical protein